MVVEASALTPVAPAAAADAPANTIASTACLMTVANYAVRAGSLDREADAAGWWMKWNINDDPLALTVAQAAPLAPAAQVTTPSEAPISMTCSSTPPVVLIDVGPA